MSSSASKSLGIRLAGKAEHLVPHEMQPNYRWNIGHIIIMALQRIANHGFEFIDGLRLGGDGFAQCARDPAAVDGIFFNLKYDQSS